MPYIPIEESPNLNLNMDAVTDKTLVVDSEMNPRYKQLLENDKSLAYPIFDDSGSVPGITSFNDFLGTLKSRMRIFDFYKNFKAGMQFVMHLGRAANNCTTTAEGLYLDARQGKVLMDLYTKLNSDLNNKTLLNQRIMSGALLLETIDLNELMSGFYRCYLINTVHSPLNDTELQSGKMGYTLSYNTWPLSETNTFHGFQIFVDVSKSNIYFRAHVYNEPAYKSWKLLS